MLPGSAPEEMEQERVSRMCRIYKHPWKCLNMPTKQKQPSLSCMRTKRKEKGKQKAAASGRFIKGAFQAPWPISLSYSPAVCWPCLPLIGSSAHVFDSCLLSTPERPGTSLPEQNQGLCYLVHLQHAIGTEEPKLPFIQELPSSLPSPQPLLSPQHSQPAKDN